jgi:diacylglycerol kinase
MSKVAPGIPLPFGSEKQMSALLPITDPEQVEIPRRRRSWRRKFQAAFKGLKLGIRGHSSFFVHFFFTALVLAAAIVLRCDVIDWCILLGCIAMVLVSELFNSAIETLFKGLDDAAKERAWPSLDIAAGAVLLAAIAASVIGAIVFLNRLSSLLQ